MAGIADAVKLREFTNRHPQIKIEEVQKIRAPITGKTVCGLYVGEVGRVHPEDCTSTRSERLIIDLSFPDPSEIPEVTVGPWTPFETTYQLHFPPGRDPIDKLYTPTSHRAPLPVGAKSPPSI